MHNDKLYIERYAYDLRRLLSTNDGHSTRTRFYMLKDAVIKDVYENRSARTAHTSLIRSDQSAWQENGLLCVHATAIVCGSTTAK